MVSVPAPEQLNKPALVVYSANLVLWVLAAVIYVC